MRNEIKKEANKQKHDTIYKYIILTTTNSTSTTSTCVVHNKKVKYKSKEEEVK